MRSRRQWIIRIAAFGMVAVFVISFAGVVTARQRRAGHRHHHRFENVLMAFGAMHGVEDGFLGPGNAVRGIAGDELPWEVEGSARGVLTKDGQLRIKVRGLVFADVPEVPPELRGINDETEFRAMVSCESVDATGAVTTVNVVSEGFPATPSGDSRIDAHIALPNPCVAPIILVLAGSEDRWFAMNGFEDEEDGEGDDDDDDDDDDHDDDDDDDDDDDEDDD